MDSLIETVARQVEASAGNLKTSGADPQLVDICLSHFNDIARDHATRLATANAAKDQRIADLEGALDQIQGAFDLKDAINLARATLNATPKEGEGR